jgi:hypothetical protein
VQVQFIGRLDEKVSLLGSLCCSWPEEVEEDLQVQFIGRSDEKVSL